MAAAPSSPPSPDTGIVDGFFVVVAGIVIFVGFVDFLRGKEGQERLRNRLEDWWLRLQYVTWRNVWQEEAAWFLSLLDRYLTDELASNRRLAICFTYGAIILVLAEILEYMVGAKLPSTYRVQDFALHFVLVAFTAAMLSISISITQGYYSFLLRRKITRISLQFMFFVSIYSQMLIVAITPLATPLFIQISINLATSIFNSLEFYSRFMKENAASFAYLSTRFDQIRPWDFLTAGVYLQVRDLIAELQSVQSGVATSFILLGVMLNLARVAIVLLFVGSWAMRSLLKSFASILLLRLAETEKGTLTFVAGGIGAAAKVVQEGIKRWPLF